MSILEAFNTHKVSAKYSQSEISLAHKYLDMKKAEQQKEQMIATTATATTAPTPNNTNNKNNKESPMKKPVMKSDLTAIIARREPVEGLIQKLGIFTKTPTSGRYAEIYARQINGQHDEAVNPASSESNSHQVSQGKLHSFEYNYSHSVQNITAADVSHRLSISSGLKEVEVVADLQGEYMMVQQDTASRTRHKALAAALFTGKANVPFAKNEENKVVDYTVEFGAYASSTLDVTASGDVLVQMDAVVRDIKRRAGSLSSRMVGLVALCGSDAFIKVTNHTSVTSVKLLGEPQTLLTYQEKIQGYNSKLFKNVLWIDTASEYSELATDEIVIVPIFSQDGSPFVEIYGNHTRQLERVNASPEYLYQVSFEDKEGKTLSVQSEYSFLAVNAAPDLITKLSLKAAK